tara:strand:+ start:61 stop:678 length:618 start_codon:yes stop_codon:yes gene_type:complete
MPSNSQIELAATDISAPGGGLGPVTLKVTNPASGGGGGGGQPAFLAWSAPVTPPTPPEPVTYPVFIDAIPGIKYIGMDITINSSTSIDITVTDSSDNWTTNDYVDVDGADIGGVTGVNNITVNFTEVNPSPQGYAITLAYGGGLIPGSPSPQQPTVDNPTAVVVVGVGQTELIQIPNSIQSPNFNILTLSVGGAAVYVTPVQIVA